MENEVWIYYAILLLHHHGNKQVEDAIEARARSLDIIAAHSCYELLYSYHVSHSNYRKGTCTECVFSLLLIIEHSILVTNNRT